MKIFVNTLTTFRLLISLILPFIKNKITGILFIIIIALAFLSDCIDGKLSRKYNVQTLYGSMMDTLADKVITIILMLMIFSNIKILLITAIFEIIIAFISLISWILGKKIKVHIIGKIKMWILCVNIIIGYLYYFGILNYVIIYYSTILTISTQIIVLFIYTNLVLREKNDKSNIFKVKSLKEIKYMLFSTEYYKSVIDPS